MTFEHDEIESSIGFWLTMSNLAYHRVFNEMSARYGITFRYAQIIGLLQRESELTQSELAERLGVESSTVGGILARMESDGWVECSTSANGKTKRIRVKTKILGIQQKVIDVSRMVREQAVEGFTVDEEETLKKLLVHVYRNLDWSSKNLT